MNDMPNPTETTRAPSDPESRLMQDIIQNLGNLPASIHRIQFRLGEDSQGDPCIWIELVMDDDLNPSKEKMADIRRVKAELRNAIMLSDTERWPYVGIVTE
jgi:hypothetical protein